MITPIPVALFAYARPRLLKRTLECLQANDVPLIYAFSDGRKSLEAMPHVAEVRETLRAIDWCEVVLCERDENLGLGRSIRTGVSEVLTKHDSVIVFEDDLICVQGTYKYLSHALRHYAGDGQVMSVTGWTHPRVTPSNVTDQPYFDGRAECLVWGTWARAWLGMEENAKSLMLKCAERGTDIRRYGDDLPPMAEVEIDMNIWAVRWLYLHILRGGLSLRPPYSMVEHIGWGASATNAGDALEWAHRKLGDCPPIPEQWPPALENPDCARLWQKACRNPTFLDRVRRKIVRLASKAMLRRS